MVGRYEVYVLFDSITVTTDNGDKGLLMDCLDYAVLLQLIIKRSI